MINGVNLCNIQRNRTWVLPYCLSIMAVFFRKCVLKKRKIQRTWDTEDCYIYNLLFEIPDQTALMPLFIYLLVATHLEAKTDQLGQLTWFDLLPGS